MAAGAPMTGPGIGAMGSAALTAGTAWAVGGGACGEGGAMTLRSLHRLGWLHRGRLLRCLRELGCLRGLGCLGLLGVLRRQARLRLLAGEPLGLLVPGDRALSITVRHHAVDRVPAGRRSALLLVRSRLVVPRAVAVGGRAVPCGHGGRCLGLGLSIRGLRCGPRLGCGRCLRCDWRRRNSGELLSGRLLCHGLLCHGLLARWLIGGGRLRPGRRHRRRLTAGAACPAAPELPARSDPVRQSRVASRSLAACRHPAAPRGCLARPVCQERPAYRAHRAARCRSARPRPANSTRPSPGTARWPERAAAT